MRCCQLCGCASWGPIKDPEVHKEIFATPIKRGVDTAVLRDRNRILVECDGCGSFADEALLAEPTGVHLGDFKPHAMHPLDFEPPSIDYTEAARSAQTMLQGMGVIPKTPETRAERLLCAFLRVEGFRTFANVSVGGLVSTVREIESELDRSASPPAAAVPVLKPRHFTSDLLLPAQHWAYQLGASKRLGEELLPVVLDIAITFGALEALTGNASLSQVTAVDRLYWEKVGRLSRWGTA